MRQKKLNARVPFFDRRNFEGKKGVFSIKSRLLPLFRRKSKFVGLNSVI